MLSVKFICVGKMRERCFTEAFSEYQKRLGRFCKLELVEVQEQRLTENPSAADIKLALDREAADILHAIAQDAYVTALCVEGEQQPSEGMARLISQRENSGKPKLCFVVGGSFGLSPDVKRRADLRLSMSKMTFPHHLARVMLIEQLYRGFKINEGSKYHK